MEQARGEGVKGHMREGAHYYPHYMHSPREGYKPEGYKGGAAQSGERYKGQPPYSAPYHHYPYPIDYPQYSRGEKGYEYPPPPGEREKAKPGEKGYDYSIMHYPPWHHHYPPYYLPPHFGHP